MLANPSDRGASSRTWLLQKQYEEVNTNFRTCWDLWLKFYTVFLTFDIAGIALIVSHDRPLKHSHAIAIVFVLQTVLTSITSAKMAIFSESSRDHLEAARHALLCEDSDTTPIPPISMPVDLAKWSGWANCGVMAAMALVWIALARAG